MSQPSREPLRVLPIPKYVPKHRQEEWIDGQESVLIQVLNRLDRMERKQDRSTDRNDDTLRRHTNLITIHTIVMLGFLVTFVAVMIGPRIFGWTGIILIGGMVVVSALTTLVIHMVRKHLR